MMRRFIAGASCRVCGAEDKVYVESSVEHDGKLRGCAACGDTESLESLMQNTDSGVDEPSPVRLITPSDKR